MEVLSHGSLFADILQENWRHQASLYDTVSFYEGIGNIVSRTSAVSTVYGKELKLDASHRDMCRFDLSQEKDQQNYRLVISNLRRICNNASSQVRNQDDGRMREVQGWLTLVNGAVINEIVSHQRAAAVRQNGTGRWFVKSHAFSDWLSDDRNGFLWIRGIPGAGKTILASTIINEIQSYIPKQEQQTGFAYFYCDYRDPVKSNSAVVLQHLLAQLARNSRTRLFHSLAEILLSKKAASNAYQTLALGIDTTIELLVKATTDFQDILLVIDASDECKDPVLAQKLVEIYECSNHKIKILVTSRIEYWIQSSFGGLPQITLDKENTAPDIALHVKTQVEKKIETNPRWLGASETLAVSKIISTIVDKADGMFLLANYHLESVLKQRRNKDIAIALRNLPTSIDDTYARILKSTEVDDDGGETYQLVIRVLRWLAEAVRPLHLDEIAEAIAVEEGQRRHDPELVFNEPERLIELCGSLIRQDPETDDVFLAHYSLKEYLTSQRILNPEDGSADASKYYLELSETNENLANVCLTYLLFEDFSPICGTVEERDRRREKYRFLDYAAFLGGDHLKRIRMKHGGARNPEDNDDEEMISVPKAAIVGESETSGFHNLLVHLFTSAWLYFILWIQSVTFRSTSQVQFPSIEGVDDKEHKEITDKDCSLALRTKTVEVTLQHTNCLSWIQLYRHLAPVKKKDHHANITPLYYAALFNWEAGVETILKRTRSRASTSDLNHALRAASMGGSAAICDMLLKEGADVDAHSPRLGSALQTAAFCANQEVVQTLLESGAMVEVEQDFYRSGGTVGSALQAAALGGNQEMVAMLLARGANINNSRGWVGTPLTAILEHAMFEMASFLLDNGADPGLVTGYYGSSMTMICGYNRQEHDRRLLRRMLEVSRPDVKNPPYGDLLQTASYTNTSAMLDLLLEHGADINTPPGVYGTAIQAAPFGPDPSNVAVPLSHGANANSQAAFIGDTHSLCTLPFYGRVVLLLGGKGLQERWWKPTNRDEQFELHKVWDGPFQIGAFYGPAIYAAVRLQMTPHNKKLLLLEHEPTHQNGHFGNPLQAAAFSNNISALQELLRSPDKKADVNKSNGIFGTALQAASYQGHIEASRILLESGADPQIQSGFYGFSLSAAIARGHVDSQCLLFDHGTKLVSPDQHGWTAIHWFAHTRQVLDTDKLAVEAPSMNFRSPSAWNTADKSPQVDVNDNGLESYYHGKVPHLRFFGIHASLAASILADHPLPPASDFYFEVEVLFIGLQRIFSLGVCDGLMPRYKLPGLEICSWGYHSDDGKGFAEGRAQMQGPVFGTGDVVGCGFTWTVNSLYFTLNGFKLEEGFTIPQGLRLFPTVGFQSEGSRIRANFGSTGFKYNPEL